MDSAKTTTHVSLCAGYGGIDLGLKRVVKDLRTVAFCEIEAFACANLVAKMEAEQLDAAPVWTNLKTFPFGQFHGLVDILSGGYPCQPFSTAGKRQGVDDPRHLWPWIRNGVAAMRPRVCFFENVEGHVSLGLSTVVSALEELGYTVSWGIFSAAEVGAPHQRKRVFILAVGLADCDKPGLERWHAGILPERAGERSAWPSRPSEPQYAWEPPRVVTKRAAVDDTEKRCVRGDGENERAPLEHGDAPHLPSNGSGDGTVEECGQADTTDTRRTGAENARADCGDASAGARSQESERVGGLGNTPQQLLDRSRDTGAGRGQEPADTNQRQTQPPLGGDADGTPGGLDYAELCRSCDNRTDELRLLGNGVVPASAAKAFVTLWSELFP